MSDKNPKPFTQLSEEEIKGYAHRAWLEDVEESQVIADWSEAEDF